MTKEVTRARHGDSLAPSGRTVENRPYGCVSMTAETGETRLGEFQTESPSTLENRRAQQTTEIESAENLIKTLGKSMSF